MASIIFCAAACLCRAQVDLAAKSAAAREAMVSGRYADAAKLYREMEAAVAEGTPEKTGLRINLAVALEKSGQPAEAIAPLEHAVRAQAGNSAAWFLLGLAYQQLGQPAKAIAPLWRAVRLPGANDQAWLELGDAQLASGRPRDAVDSFQALADRSPGLAKAREGLGLAYLALGERAFTALQEMAPDSPYAVALIRHAKKNEPAALIEEPAWHRAGEWKSGLAGAEKSASAANLYWAALACEKLAEEQFARLRQMPSTAELHELLAQSYSRLGRRSDAVAEWRLALKLQPGDRRIQGRLAEALVRDRRLAEARALIEPLAAAEPQNGEFQYLLGDVLLEEKQEDAALPYLERAQALLPDHLSAQEALGRAYLALGDAQKAITHLERARPLDDGAISFSLSVAYARLGRDAEARAARARYQLLTAESR